MLADESSIRMAIKEIVHDRLNNVEIVSVDIKEDESEDGDKILRIRIVFDTPKKLDAKKVAGLLRHLRPKLFESGEERFPLMSFVSRSDAHRLTPEAA